MILFNYIVEILTLPDHDSLVTFPIISLNSTIKHQEFELGVREPVPKGFGFALALKV
jgi:hypothetical protein